MVDINVIKLGIKSKRNIFSSLMRLAENEMFSVLKIIFFIGSRDSKDYLAKTKYIHNVIYEIHKINKYFNPIVLVVCQESLEKNFVDIEAVTFTKSYSNAVKYKEFESLKYNIVETPNLKYLFFATQPLNEKSCSLNIFYNTVIKCYHDLEKVLNLEGMALSNVVRQWTYIENILNLDEYEVGIKQKYQLFNDIRSYFHSTQNFVSGLMAATGIGTFSGCFAIDIIGVQSKYNDVKIIPINNPCQVNPFDYSSDKLIGTPLELTRSLRTPSFARAKAIYTNKKLLLFISGTSSVIGEDSVASGNVWQQFRITLNNIDCVIHECNLFNFEGVVLNDDNVISLRVYLNDLNALSKIKRLIHKKYINAIILFIYADVCRNDLSIEIEAILKA